MSRFDGRTALVVGAGSVGPGWGNGKAAAVLFAREGARVLCVDINARGCPRDRRDRSGAMAVRPKRGRRMRRARPTWSAWSRRVSSASTAIDVLQNNVGIAEVGGVTELSEETWDRVFAVNLKSCFLAMKHVLPIMEREGGGAIVNISSIASIRYTGVAYATYSATKAAMNQLTRTTAVEFASKGIRVNAVLPGLMKTPMVERSAGLAGAYGGGDVEAMWRAREAQCPMGHMGDAWDVAHAALFLASDEARYITGVELVVDGGITLKCD